MACMVHGGAARQERRLWLRWALTRRIVHTPAAFLPYGVRLLLECGRGGRLKAAGKAGCRPNALAVLGRLQVPLCAYAAQEPPLHVLSASW